MTDDGGVLGNLPSSRPGKRSAKRDRPAKTAAKPRKRTTAVKGPGSSDRVDGVHDMDAKGRHDPEGSPGDAIGAVVRGAAGVAVTGVKVAGAVTHELLRRLPRP